MEAIDWLEKTVLNTLNENIDCCIHWPYSKSNQGTGKFVKNKRFFQASRYALIFATMKDGGITRHKCKTKDCVNPNHLEWGSHRDNCVDKYRDGTAGQKLSNAQVIEIANSNKSTEDLERLFGVSDAAIQHIKNGTTWGFLTGIKRHDSRRKLADRDIIEISKSQEKNRVLMERYGVSQPLISSIRSGRKYSEITGVNHG